MSISVTSGISQAISETRSSSASSAGRSTAGRLRNSSSIFEMRVLSIMSETRAALSGGSATARSRSTSTAMPPAPKVMAGPNTGSRAMPTMSSRPLPRETMRSTDTPVTRASGRRDFTLVIMYTYASRTACAFASPSRTPPTSLLWVMSGEWIFMTIG